MRVRDNERVLWPSGRLGRPGTDMREPTGDLSINLWLNHTSCTGNIFQRFRPGGNRAVDGDRYALGRPEHG